MSSYGSLAGWYDRLTEDVDYSAFADLYEELFRSSGEEIQLVLDLCCGTGTLTLEMAQRGYELIAVDASPDMLMQAQRKCFSCEKSPLFICQPAEELDLYGTVDAAYSSLDSVNYIAPDLLDEVFRRLRLFVRPGGLLIFDIRNPEWMEQMNGFTSVDEDEGMFCVWRADFDQQEKVLLYGMDLFTRKGSSWLREKEEHVEHAHSVEFLFDLMRRHGFEPALVDGSSVSDASERLFLKAIRK